MSNSLQITPRMLISPAPPLFLPAVQPLVHNACTLLESAAQLLHLPRQHPKQLQHQTSKTPGKLDDTPTSASTDQHRLRDQQQPGGVAQLLSKLKLQDDAAAAAAMHDELPCGSQVVAVAQGIQEIGEALLAKAEPRLAQLRCWPLCGVQGFSQHQMVESVQEAHEAVAAAQQLLQ
jgi:hypothetical protein